MRDTWGEVLLIMRIPIFGRSIKRDHSFGYDEVVIDRVLRYLYVYEAARTSRVSKLFFNAYINMYPDGQVLSLCGMKSSRGCIHLYPLGYSSHDDPGAFLLKSIYEHMVLVKGPFRDIIFGRLKEDSLTYFRGMLMPKKKYDKILEREYTAHLWHSLYAPYEGCVDIENTLTCNIIITNVGIGSRNNYRVGVSNGNLELIHTTSWQDHFIGIINDCKTYCQPIIIMDNNYVRDIAIKYFDKYIDPSNVNGIFIGIE